MRIADRPPSPLFPATGPSTAPAEAGSDCRRFSVPQLCRQSQAPSGRDGLGINLLWDLHDSVHLCSTTAALRPIVGHMLGAFCPSTHAVGLHAPPILHAVVPEATAVASRSPSSAVSRKLLPEAIVPSTPRAILPDGRAIPPDSYMGGYHGNGRVPPEVALRDGLPARGNDWRLLEHAEQRGNSAFRGTTDFPTDPSGTYGAAYWAGEGGWVYEIRDVPSWDVNIALQGRVRTPAGFRGNLMCGEAERAIPAVVPPEKIKRFGKVETDPMGHLCVRHWVDNPLYKSHAPV